MKKKNFGTIRKLMVVALSVCLMAAFMVSSPTAMTTALALPLMTLLPIKARLLMSESDPESELSVDCFSTGSLSPVRADWLTKRSLAASMRKSAGIMYRAFYNIGISSIAVGAYWFTKATLIVLALPLGLIFARIFTDTRFRHCN